MQTIQISDVNDVAASMKGKRLEKFLLSVQILNDSAAAEEWIFPRARGKAFAGLGQGLRSKRGERHPNFDIDMCLTYGRSPLLAPLAEFADKLSPVELAWARLCTAAHAIADELDAARPKPKVTPIGLSPKVTATLRECNLDIDLPTIRPAKIVRREVVVRARDKNHVPLCNEDGTPKMATIVVYAVEWTPGISHNMSRFISGCQACGKRIWSGRFVAIEATCRRNGLISLWLGCDCARNIFGVKDVGIDRS